jgi:hypothetical protein
MMKESLVALSCPVCQRSQITTATCPNCEADLSALRILATLPPASIGLDYRWLGLAIATAILGFLAAKIQL